MTIRQTAHHLRYRNFVPAINPYPIDYRVGWWAYVSGAAYGRMATEGQRNGWQASRRADRAMRRAGLQARPT